VSSRRALRSVICDRRGERCKKMERVTETIMELSFSAEGSDLRQERGEVSRKKGTDLRSELSLQISKASYMLP